MERFEQSAIAEGGSEGDRRRRGVSPLLGAAVDADQGLKASEEASTASIASEVGRRWIEGGDRFSERRKRDRRSAGIVGRDAGASPELDLDFSDDGGWKIDGH